MLKDITAVFFDLDGTLLNSLEDLKDSVNFALSSKAYPKRSLEEVRQFIGNGAKKLMERSAPNHTPLEIQEELYQTFRSHYKNNCAKTTKPYDGILDLVDGLEDKGYCLGIVSNKSHVETKALTEIFFPKIPFVQGSTEDLPRKPNPAGLIQGLSFFHLNPKNAIYVGDSGVDVETAHNAKMQCIGVTWGYRDKEVLESMGADYIVDAPERIWQLMTGEKE